MPRKCFSLCIKKPQSECLPPKCRYATGKKRSFCRLSRGYNMTDECDLEERIFTPLKIYTSKIKNLEINYWNSDFQ